MEQAISALNRAVNSNAVVNTMLVAVFGALAGRSVAQERSIAALEAEKDSLLKANKVIKNTIWDWKQKLYAEAETSPQNAIVPLSTLKSIYGEVVIPAPDILTGEHGASSCSFACCVTDTDMATRRDDLIN